MTRVLSGAVLLVLAIAAVWLASAPVFFLVAEALLVLAFTEYVELARANGVAVPAIPAGIAAMSTAAAFARPGGGISIEVVLMSAFAVLAVMTMVQWRGGPDALGHSAAAVLPSLYLGLPIGAMIAIRDARGREVLFLLMLTVFVSDTAQYYTGRAFGRRPLAPRISPKKTIEGAVGGFVFGALLMVVAGAYWLPAVPLLARAVIGVLIVALGIAGDLFESMLKRSARVKDSSSLIPGHGGVLDRIDALLFAAPVYYIVLKYV